MIKIIGFFYFCILFYIFFLARRRPHPTFFLHKAPVNLIPVRNKLITISEYNKLISADRWLFISDLFGNIILFLPLPFFLFFIFGIKKSSKIIFVSCLTSICIEFIQFFFSIGMADIDDVILNTLGAALGVVILKALKK
ncbi:MAG: VanZ family protein, partial [Bacteroidota bacterium]